MTRPVASVNRIFFYRLASPILFIPWIWTQFFAAAISWALIALYSVWTWNVTLYYIPTWTMFAFFVLAPFQESQVQVINVVELVAENIDTFVDDILFPIIEDLFYVVQPGCWAYNFLWDSVITLFRIAIYDPIAQALRTIFPTNASWGFDLFLDVPFAASSFPLSTEIDTSSSPDWIVGPYGRSATGKAIDPRFDAHPLLDGTRRVDPRDPAAAALVRWLRKYGDNGIYGSGGASHGVVKLVVHPDLLDKWTDPTVSETARRAISEQLLRRAMDRSLGIEEPGWWEPDPEDPEGKSKAQTSVWNRVFEVPEGDWRGMGVVRMDSIPDLVAEYGPERARNVHVPPGSVAYRFLADERGTRALNFAIFQATAALFATFFDAVVNVLVELWEIVLVVADFLFSNLETFFTNAISFVANVFNEIWAEFLGLPCLKFDSVEVFAITLLDCICEPLAQAAINFFGGSAAQWFTYQKPSSIEELPQAMLGCVGLGCINITLLVTEPNAFASQLFGECMNLPDRVVCCIIDPVNCLTNTIMGLSNCDCPNNAGSVSPPGCDYDSNTSDEFLRCIVMWIMNTLLDPLGGVSACEVGGCPSTGSLGTTFIQCIALQVLRVPNFINSLVPILEDIFSFDDIGSSLGGITIFTRGGMPQDEFQRRTESEEAKQEAAASEERKWSDYQDGGGKGRMGVGNPAYRSHVKVAVQRMKDEQQARLELAGNTTAHLEQYYGRGTTNRLMQLVESQREESLRRFFQDLEPVDPELELMALKRRGAHYGLMGSPYDDDTQDLDQPKMPAFMQQLSSMVRKESRSRARARLQARVDRRLYSNPYLRAATGRLTEIVRDLIDFAEFRIYGADPFAQPPADADPDEDPRIHAARYIDETQMHAHAYAIHQQAVLDNPYYAGLYKMLFQIGDADSIGRHETGGQELGNGTVTPTTSSDAAWEAMATHADNPLFHMGRMMAASRQLIYSYSVILNEVWWEPDSFSFHFPNYDQMFRLAQQTHLPAYMDDMRAAMTGLFRAKSAEAHTMLLDHAMRYSEEADLDPEAAAEHHSGPVQAYSWLVQTEVAVRTVATRLLSPRHLEPMLDELTTRSPLHARYSQRMRMRVNELRDQSPHDQRALSDRIEEWRRERGGTVDREDGGVDNRPLVDLDPEAHPDAGNTTLLRGERVRFADGLMGTYLGTVGSRSPLSPTSPTLGLDTRVPQILAVAKGFIKVIQFVISNWRLIATAFVTVVVSPWGRVFWESWLQFIYNRIVKPLYTGGLRNVFGSLFDILVLVFDFQILNETIWYFLMNELFRYILCFAWVALIVSVVFLPLFIIQGFLSAGLLSGPLIIVATGVIAIGLIFPYCPPEQVLENNRLTQSPFNYFDDIIKCFGDPDISSLSIGKAVYNGICSVKTDCRGNAPCICENKGGQFSSAFAAFTDDTPCGTAAAPTGQCLCWPKIDCQFLFPRIGLDRLFDVDCADDFGYRINDITWYQTSDYLKVFINAYLNFWIGVRYITRQLTGSPGINPLMFPLLVAISFLVLFYGSVYFGLILLVIVMSWQYALPLWSEITIKHIIPGLSRVSGNSFWPLTVLANWFLRFLRFPNFSDGDPLGSAGDGEGVCWFFNAGTLFGGGSVAFWFWATILALAWYGLGSIIWFVFNNVMTPVRIIYAPFWLYWQRSRLSRHFDKAKDMIRRSTPQWMRRGAGTAGATLWDITSSVGARMAPSPPNFKLNRWITKRYPDPRQRWDPDRLWQQYLHEQQQAHATVIRDEPAGYGGGILEHEIMDPATMTTIVDDPASPPPTAHGQAATRRRRPAGAFLPEIVDEQEGEAGADDVDPEMGSSDHAKQT